MGGLGGIVAGIIFFPAAALVFPNLPQPGLGSVEETLRQLVQNRTPLIIGSAFWLVISLLLIPFFLALYRSLREANLGYALLGSVLGVLAAAVIAILVSVSSSSALGLAELYDKAAAADKPMVITVAEATSRWTPGGFFQVEGVFRAIALIAIGGAMLESPAFKKGYGWMSVIIGIVFLLPVGFFLPVFFIFIEILFLIWLILVGFRVYRLSKAT